MPLLPALHTSSDKINDAAQAMHFWIFMKRNCVTFHRNAKKKLYHFVQQLTTVPLSSNSIQTTGMTKIGENQLKNAVSPQRSWYKFMDKRSDYCKNYIIFMKWNGPMFEQQMLCIAICSVRMQWDAPVVVKNVIQQMEVLSNEDYQPKRLHVRCQNFAYAPI